MLKIEKNLLDSLEMLHRSKCVADLVEHYMNTFPSLVIDPPSLPTRLMNAYNYLINLKFTDNLLIAKYLYIVAVAPEILQNKQIIHWIEKPGQHPEQRFKDMLVIMEYCHANNISDNYCESFNKL